MGKKKVLLFSLLIAIVIYNRSMTIWKSGLSSKLMLPLLEVINPISLIIAFSKRLISEKICVNPLHRSLRAWDNHQSFSILWVLRFLQTILLSVSNSKVGRIKRSQLFQWFSQLYKSGIESVQSGWGKNYVLEVKEPGQNMWSSCYQQLLQDHQWLTPRCFLV